MPSSISSFAASLSGESRSKHSPGDSRRQFFITASARQSESPNTRGISSKSLTRAFRSSRRMSSATRFAASCEPS